MTTPHYTVCDVGCDQPNSCVVVLTRIKFFFLIINNISVSIRYKLIAILEKIRDWLKSRSVIGNRRREKSRSCADMKEIKRNSVACRRYYVRVAFSDLE